MNAYILIGGRSTRMGTPKPFIDLGGVSILERVVTAAGSVFHAVYAVQTSDGEAAMIVPTIREEAHEGTAPVWGVRAALRHARGRCFVIAVDYPLITVELLAYLRQQFTQASTPMLVPVWNGRAQTLCAGFDSVLLRTIDRRIEEGHLDLRGLIDEGPAMLLEEEHLRELFRGEPLLNVNTPDELERARTLLQAVIDSEAE